jgi:ubiquinone/menaquinone biosynthesis C-methylase UbiE
MMRLQRRFKDLGIEGATARWYDKNTKEHRLMEMKGYAKEVRRHIRDGSSVLEVAPGPGYLAIELAKLGKYKIIGLDISKDFVEIARRNAESAYVNVKFQHGNVVDMPFADNTFDFIVCIAAFKNFKEPLLALNQMHRVLKPSGTTLIIDMNRNASNRQIEEYIEELEANVRERLLMRLIFKYFLRNGAYTRDEFTELISKSQFNHHEIKEDKIGFYIYLRKGF